MLAHGSGGKLSHDLIEQCFLPFLSNPILNKLDDSAILELSGRLAFTTDSYTVNPIFFPGGDLGGVQRESAAAQEQFVSGLERHVAELFRSYGDSLPPVGLYHRVLRDLEVPLIVATLTVTRGNQIKAAEILGLNRNTLRKKIRDLDLRGARGVK